MRRLKTFTSALFLGVLLIGCNDDDDASQAVVLDAGTLSGGPFSFVVDGVPDMVSGITLDDSSLTGSSQMYIITDSSKNILGMPPTLEAVNGVDFDGAGVGSCYIYHVTFDGTLSGVEVGENLDNVTGEFALSNFIEVDRAGLNAGELSGGPFEFVIDGMPDMVSGIALDDAELNGETQTYVITNSDLNILAIPPTLEAVEGINFENPGPGTCNIYHLTYSGELDGLTMGESITDLSGQFALSNFITVQRDPLNAGTLSGGPFTFTIDGTPDMVSGLSLDDTELNGSVQTYLVTRDDLTILAIPATLEDVEAINFENPGVGVCLIWHLTYEDGLMGLAQGENAADLDGSFALSNSLMVTRQ